MALRPQRYRSVKAQNIIDPATRLAFEDMALKIEQLARDAETRVAGIPTGDTFPAGAIVFWLGTAASIPAGWEEVTALRSRFPRGMASGGTPSATGGNATHGHGINGSLASANVWAKVAAGTSYDVATQPHIHGVGDLGTTSASSLPPYVDGIWIRKL